MFMANLVKHSLTNCVVFRPCLVKDEWSATVCRLVNKITWPRQLVEDNRSGFGLTLGPRGKLPSLTLACWLTVSSGSLLVLSILCLLSVCRTILSGLRCSLILIRLFRIKSILVRLVGLRVFCLVTSWGVAFIAGLAAVVRYRTLRSCSPQLTGPSLSTLGSTTSRTSSRETALLLWRTITYALTRSHRITKVSFRSLGFRSRRLVPFSLPPWRWSCSRGCGSGSLSSAVVSSRSLPSAVANVVP